METLNFNTPVRDSEGNIKNLSEVGGGGGSAKHTYSTDEHIVGVWIDGKPIYEKTFDLTGLGLPLNVADLHIDNALTLDGYHTNNDSYIQLNESLSGISAWCHFVKSTNEYRGALTGLTATKTIITITYTKTTD